jgi:serine/threonine-protein kinase RsbW
VDDDGDRIRLTVPATSASARITRVGAASLATGAGFTYREVEQMRLAVNEATALLAPHPATEGRLVVVYAVHPDRLHVEVRREGVDEAAAVTVPELAALLLDACVDGWEVSPAGGTVALHKRRTRYEDDDDAGTDEAPG